MEPSPDTSSTSPTSSQDQERTSKEDARRFVEQLRSAPAEQVMADVFSTLLTAAEVKLGRRDARLLIDVCAISLDHAGRYLSEELRKQVESMLGQLRLGQVSAESHLSEKGDASPNDLSEMPRPPATGARTEAPASRPSSASPSEPSPSSRLWVPGR